MIQQSQAMKLFSRFFVAAALTVAGALVNSAYAADRGGKPVRKVAVLDTRGRMTVDRKPAFPLGIFVAIQPEWIDNHPELLQEQLDDLSASPFQFTINYAGRGGSPEQRKRYLTSLHEHGLMEFVSLEKYFKDIGNPSWQEEFEGTEQEAITREVKLARNWPGIAGWYIFDELPLNPDLVRQHHEWVKQIDPQRPTLSLTSRHELADIRKFASTGDIYALDRYPLPVRGSMTIVADAMDRMVKSGEKGQSLWFVLQTFGDYVYNDDFRSGKQSVRPLKLRGELRAPTPEEIHCMTYLSIVHGATGVVAYYYKDIKLSLDADVRWNAMKATAADVAEIGPILLSPPMSGDAFRCDNPEVHWRAVEKDGKIYLIAVNASRSLQTAWFDGWRRPIGKVSVVQGTALAVGSNESPRPRVALQLDALETLVIEIE